MPKKKFEETPYDPISADLARDAAAVGRTSAAVSTAVAKAEPRVIVPLHPVEQQPATSTKEAVREAIVTRRFKLRVSESEELNAFLARLEREAHTKVYFSILMRAALNLMMQSEPQLIAEIAGAIPRALPSTLDAMAMAEFEDRWMHCLASAFRRLPKSGERFGR